MTHSHRFRAKKKGPSLRRRRQCSNLIHMWTTSRTTYCSRRTWSIIRCSPLQDTVPSKSKVILRFTRKSKDQQGQPSTKMLRFWWSTTTSSARCQCPLSLTSSRLNTTWRRMARKVSIWSSTASKNRARPTI